MTQLKAADYPAVLNSFDARHILECGQVFRYTAHENGGYTVISRDKKADIVGQTIKSSDPDYFSNYFDLKTDYELIKTRLLAKDNSGILREAISYGDGIRILRQDLHETIFNFIISANNHIPRIKSIIERLCSALGQNMGDFFAFPTVDKLANQSVDFFLSCGLGYRAEYIKKTAKMIADGFDFSGIKAKSHPDANKYLCRLAGVGPKVADCILLFGLHRMDAFPVDTWIEKVYKEHFATELGEFKNAQTASQMLCEKFGDLSGFAQQYLFFYRRQKTIDKTK